MQRVLSAGLGLLMLVCAAETARADGPGYQSPFSWTGLYIGLDGGYLWSRGTIILPTSPIATATPDPDGLAAGVHLGYRHQFGSGFVLGVEADAWGLFDSNGPGLALYDPSPGSAGILALDWGVSVRALVGLASDRWLVYATGGAAYVSLSGCNSHFLITPGCFPGESFSDGRWGWTLGAGLAYAFSPRLSGRIEYLFADYGSETYVPTTHLDAIHVDLETHTVRVGLSYKLSPN